MDSNHPDRLFRFKEFELCDSAGAMKIGTDGVLLGSWCTVEKDDIVWDAGCGTALIGLMTLQRRAKSVIGFEVNEAAAFEAEKNVSNSPWPNNMEIMKGDFLSMVDKISVPPNLLVSNPPFFTEEVKSPDKSRADARHESKLSYQAILRVASAHLAQAGRVAVIAPTSRINEILFEAELCRLSLWRMTEVVTVEGKQPKRVLLEWRKEAPTTIVKNTLCIKNSNGSFSSEYITLTENFYINIR